MSNAAQRNGKPLLGEILVTTGIISSAHLYAALEEQARTGDMLGEILVRRGRIGFLSLDWALSRQRAG